MKVYFGLSGGGIKLGSTAAGFVAELGRSEKLHDIKTTAACSVNVYLAAYLTTEHSGGTGIGLNIIGGIEFMGNSYFQKENIPNLI